MNNKDYKRYKKIKEELAQLDQDFEDVLEEIRNYYIERNMKKVKVAENKLSWVLRETNLRRTIAEELVLPKYLKIEGVVEDAKDWLKENDLGISTNDAFEEFISNYLMDEYNHNVYGFVWVVKGDDIYVTSIRWNQWQILPSDLKRCLKDCNVCVKNGEIQVYKDPSKKGMLLIKNTTTKYSRAATLKEAIKDLEDNYYM